MNKFGIIVISAVAFLVASVGVSMLSHGEDEPAAEQQPAEQPQAEQPAVEAVPGQQLEAVDRDDASYALGFQIGSTFAQQQIEVQIEQFAAGMAAALADEEPRMGREELVQTLFAFQLQMHQQQQERAGRLAQQGRTFLQQNRDAEGVQVTDSGLQYKIIEEGEGQPAGPQDIVTVHYRGRHVDGQTFDSSYDRGEPAQFRPGGVIPGWSEALQMMRPGAKWELYIPSDLAYGADGTPGGPIPPHATLIFEVELLDVDRAE